MFAQVFNDWTEQSKSLVEPLLTMNRIALGQMQKVSSRQLELANEYARIGMSQLDSLTKVQSLEDAQAFAQKQAQLGGELPSKLLQDGNDSIELCKELGGEWKDFFESHVEQFTNSFKR